MIRDQLHNSLRDALTAAGLPEPPNGIALNPADPDKGQGEWASPVAMQLARAAGAAPKEIAERLAEQLNRTPSPHLDHVEVAGPGFLNFFLRPSWLHGVLREVVAAGGAYGRGDALAGKRINLEFVSLNPTGPIHAGGARWVAVGDAIANLLEAQGAVVHREYYLNDAGGQLDTFGGSLYARYRGEELPEDGYRGEYLVEMASRLRAELGDAVTQEEAREWGYRDAVRSVQHDLERIGVRFDTWFSERTLHERSDVNEVLGILRDRGFTYEHEGAVWLRTSDLGDQRDRVLVKSDGAPTYLLPDIAYHRDKFARGWEHLVDIWGADHHGQVKSLQAGMQMLGFAPGEPEIILGQLVRIERGGELVRLSRRAGDIITLADILDEVDPDVARLTFLLQSIDTPQTFDLDVVTAQSMENPVYYVQYAHARIASIGRKAAERGVVRRPLEDVDLSVLVHARETELLRTLALYPEVVGEAADLRAPHRITTWVREFAKDFHGFYRDCRVISDDDALTQARLWLAEACQIALSDALGLLGVSAPDEMARLDDDDDAIGQQQP
ncbi:MAG: arginine--tRNA ligase [Actinomycetota bacterium]|nr:arginine--tRNA ligase [Actinomycetota bacterium]